MFVGLSNLGRGNGVWYFVYRRTLKYPRGKCWKRTTKAGFWKETGDPPQIEDGKRRILVYYEGRAGKANKTNWVLHEYESCNPTNGSPVIISCCCCCCYCCCCYYCDFRYLNDIVVAAFLTMWLFLSAAVVVIAIVVPF